MEYSQPDFYRFNQDSIFLSYKIIEIEGEKLINKNVLDLCCGCGVIGMELMKKYSIMLTGLESNKKFENYFNENKKRFFEVNEQEKISLILDKISGYNKLNNNKKKFDYIVSNPPYFKTDSGRNSTNKDRQHCRFIEQGEFIEMIGLILTFLKEDGAWWCAFSDQEDKSIFDRKIIEERFTETHCFTSPGTIARRFVFNSCEVE